MILDQKYISKESIENIPNWHDSFEEMGAQITKLLESQTKQGRSIQKIIIEVNKPTIIEFITVYNGAVTEVTDAV